MGTQVSVERMEGRPAWEVRAGGERVGVVFRQGREFRAIREGSGSPLPGAFSSRESAAKAVARAAGHRDLDDRVFDLSPPS